MNSYHFLFEISLILFSTKLLGLISRRIKLPQVVGALLAGIIIGPCVLNLVVESEFIMQLSEIGVIFLMFIAGLETDIDALKKQGKACFLIAVLGVCYKWNHLIDFHSPYGDDWWGYIWHTVFAVILTVLIYLCSQLNIQFKHIPGRIILWISKYQYGTYIWHFIIAVS